MEVDKLAGLSHTLQTVTIAILIFAVVTYLPKLQYQSQLAKLPVFGSNGEKDRQFYLTSAKKVYKDAYSKFKDSVYRVATDDGIDNVVVPPSMLAELRKLPDDVLSFPEAVAKTMETKYTKLDTDATLVVHSIKSDLTPALVRLNPTICEEVDSALRAQLPPCKDWTEVCINRDLIDVVAKVSGRVFVGAELCKDPEYLDAGANYTIDLVQAVTALKKIRPWLKPILGPRIAEVQAVRKREERAAEILRPIVAERFESKKNDPNWNEPDDMLQWLINRGDGKYSIAEIAKMQLGLIFAAVHTTSMTATNILFTLAVTPEYIEELRQEIRNAMADNDGVITSRALQQMEKLDSYMKEVTRFYPPGTTSFTRRVLKGITLSNGQYIPPGVMVEVPSAAIYTDGAFYPDSDRFDGLRHYKLRRGGAAADHARNQFVTTNETNLGFGYGRHACPGRFFAANEIKMILARLILEYDIKMPGDEKERHPQIEIGRQSMPNPMKKIMLKKVEV